MAVGPLVQLSDIIQPAVFGPYSQFRTAELATMLSGGAITIDPHLASFLSGPGWKITVPYFKDLDNDEPLIANDSPSGLYSGGHTPDPFKIGTFSQDVVKLRVANSWMASELAKDLAGSSPIKAIGDRTTAYWARWEQSLFISIMKGIFANNDANPTAGEHVKGDLTHDIKGSAFSSGVTNFTSKGFLDACQLLGDVSSSLSILMVSSYVKTALRKANLIEFIPASESKVAFETYMGFKLVVNDFMPNAGAVYDSWILGPGMMSLAHGAQEEPVHVEKDQNAGNLQGATKLIMRKYLCMHPAGFSFVGTPTQSGGPSTAATTGNYAAATSWKRVAPERKAIKIVRFRTREA